MKYDRKTFDRNVEMTRLFLGIIAYKEKPMPSFSDLAAKYNMKQPRAAACVISVIRASWPHREDRSITLNAWTNRQDIGKTLLAPAIDKLVATYIPQYYTRPPKVDIDLSTSKLFRSDK